MMHGDEPVRSSVDKLLITDSMRSRQLLGDVFLLCPFNLSFSVICNSTYIPGVASFM